MHRRVFVLFVDQSNTTSRPVSMPGLEINLFLGRLLDALPMNWRSELHLPTNAAACTHDQGKLPARGQSGVLCISISISHVCRRG